MGAQDHGAQRTRPRGTAPPGAVSHGDCHSTSLCLPNETGRRAIPGILPGHRPLRAGRFLNGSQRAERLITASGRRTWGCHAQTRSPLPPPSVSRNCPSPTFSCQPTSRSSLSCLSQAALQQQHHVQQRVGVSVTTKRVTGD